MPVVLDRIAAIQARFPLAPVLTPQGVSMTSTSRGATGLGGGPAGTDVGESFAHALDQAGLDGGLGWSGASPSSTVNPAGLLPGGTGSGPGGSSVVAAARRYLGVPYQWGGTDPATGLDCSGFVQRVFADLGVRLPRVSADQARAGRPVPDLSAARPGDLLFFDNSASRAGIDHVAIYLGGGRMIESPRSGLTVRETAVPSEPVAIRRVVDAPDRQAASMTAGAGAAGVGAVFGAARAGAARPAGGGAGSYGELFAAAESRYGLPAGLLGAVARTESGLRADAVSPAGARGLMQLMPATARGLGVDPFDPAQAIDGAGRLLAGHLQDFGSVELALAAYNAGSGAVRRYGGIPPYDETRAYVRRVLDDLRGA